MSATDTQPTGTELCETANRRVSIPNYLSDRGITLNHSGRCACPIHKGDDEDNFAVYKKSGTWRYTCHSRCGSGDLLDLHICLAGIAGKSKAHSRVLAAKDLLGITDEAVIRIPKPEVVKEVTPAAVASTDDLLGGDAPSVLPCHPNLLEPTRADLRAISELRGIAVEALRIAVIRGLLRTAIVHGHRAGIVTDENHLPAQFFYERNCYLARRLDGGYWNEDEINAGEKQKPKKTLLLKGSNGSWPIGIKETAEFTAIALVEGWPDFLAAFGHAWASGVEDKVAPVCMTSSSVSIPDDLLSYFEGKRIRIFAHNDTSETGYKAACKWVEQISKRVRYATLDVYQFNAGIRQANGRMVGDLNDLLNVSVDDWESRRNEIENVMNFATE